MVINEPGSYLKLLPFALGVNSGTLFEIGKADPAHLSRNVLVDHFKEETRGIRVELTDGSDYFYPWCRVDHLYTGESPAEIE